VDSNEYDQLGRESKKYLPYVSSLSDGLYKANASTDQQSFNQGWFSSQGENSFYNLTQFETSPLNRIAKVLAPGANWVGASRGVESQHLVNTSLDEVRAWTVTGVPGGLGTYTASFYPPNSLYKMMSVSEDGKKVVEYKDKQGQIVLKKIQIADVPSVNHTGWLCTYYIYDHLNRLRAEIQPKAVEAMNNVNNWTLDPQTLNELVFRYEYDAAGRMSMKKVPGAGTVYMVYDARDRLVMTQDANLRQQNKWLFRKYDYLNRPIITGFYTNSTYTTQSSMQDYLNSLNLALYENYNPTSYPLYSLTNSFPQVASTDVLTYTYYDDYSWVGWYGFSGTRDNSYDSYFSSSSSFPYPEVVTQATSVKGMVTGVWDKTGPGLLAQYFYDNKGRAIQRKFYNYTGGIDVTSTQYNFKSQPLTIVEKQQKAGTNPQTHIVTTRNELDDLSRVWNISKTVNSTINGVAISKPQTTTSRYIYNKLGQLAHKPLGPQYNGWSGLELLSYDYNVRGWILGMNRSYLKDKNASGYQNKYFGFELGYDKAATTPGSTTFGYTRYDGNIGGTIWKSAGDEVRRYYDYLYDNAGRFGRANYYQNSNANSGGAWSTTEMNFSVHGFDGDNNYYMKYDANGNILGMVEHGIKGLNTDVYIDALRYEYFSNSNKLRMVHDDYSDAQTKLGDFHDGNEGFWGTDYGYDKNGNLVADKNKYIDGTTGIDVTSGGAIAYNHLNLPVNIVINNSNGTPKGSIEYVYDAAGSKLKKVVHENGKPDKTTLYIAGFVYENDVLQFMPMEEGRIRFKPAAGATPASFELDYFVKDHLGNVRMVLTEEQNQTIYPAATLEGDLNANSSPNAAYIEKDYYSIDPSKVVNSSEATGITTYQNNNGVFNNNPYSQTTSNSQKLYKLIASGSSGVSGLGMTLKVMSGDKIDVFGKSYYFQQNSGGVNYNVPISAIVSGIFGAPGSLAASKGSSAAELNNSTSVTNSISSFLTNTNRGAGTTPKAYINWILFDEQFKYVDGNFSRVGGPNAVKDHYGDAQLQNIPVTKNGYLYVYVSNESPVSVFFDNLQVIHTKGRILEETHYYPFGLTMAGISSKAAGGMEGKKKYQGQEFAHSEFSDGSGLEGYEFKYRMDDPQIGRFWQIDPLASKFAYNSTYAFSENKVINGVELEGLEVVSITAAAGSFGGVLGEASGVGVAIDMEGGVQFFGVKTDKLGVGIEVGGGVMINLYGMISAHEVLGESTAWGLSGGILGAGSIEAVDAGGNSGLGMGVGIGLGASFTYSMSNATPSSSTAFMQALGGKQSLAAFKNKAIGTLDKIINQKNQKASSLSNKMAALGNEIKALGEKYNTTKSEEVLKQINSKTEQIKKLDIQVKDLQKQSKAYSNAKKSLAALTVD
jgi:hypothetical protein